jgi:toxin ParE1/3/4
MKLRVTRRATQDLADIADYIAERNPQAARRVRSAILESFRTVVLFPNAGRRQRVRNVRRLVTRRYRYGVYYTADTAMETVTI